MKKLLTILTVAALALSLAACTTDKPKPEDPDTTTSAEATTESTADAGTTADPTTEDPTTEATEPTTEPTTEVPKAIDEAEAAAVANELFEKLDLIDHLGACAVAVDPEDTVQEGDYVYSRVIDSRFPTLESLNNYLTNTLTENMLGSRYSGMVSGERVTYIDHDGALYAMQAGRGCGFDYLEAATVSELTPTSFHGQRKYDNFGGIGYLEIDVVLEDGLWKIDKMERNDG